MIVLALDDREAVISDFAMLPAHRGRGVGKSLLKFAEAQARTAGFARVSLRTNARMTADLALYIGCGYREYERRVLGTHVFVYMGKRLEQKA